MSSRRHHDVAVVIGICAITLVLGSAGKACRGFWHDPMSFLCHSDIRSLYSLRGMDREIFPYLHGELVVSRESGPPVRYGLRPVDGANEYPVLTGILMWLPSLVSSSPDTYLLASMVLLAPFGLATAWLLGRMTGRRALLWSASPMLLLYAFHNWDLAVVVASVAGFWCWWRRKPIAAAVCFGLGGGLKLYPLLFLLPLVLERVHAGDRRGAVRVGAAGVGTFVLINVPFLLLSPSGWAVAYRFHTLRVPNYDSLWGVLSWVFEMDQATVTTMSTLAVIIVLAAVTWATVRGAPDRIPSGRQGALTPVRALARPAVRPRTDPPRLVRPLRHGERAHVRRDLRRLRLEHRRTGPPGDLVGVGQGGDVPPPVDRLPSRATHGRGRSGWGGDGERVDPRRLTAFALVTYPSSGSRVARAPRRKSQPAMR